VAVERVVKENYDDEKYLSRLRLWYKFDSASETVSESPHTKHEYPKKGILSQDLRNTDTG
jgi:hypothetical protein